MQQNQQQPDLRRSGIETFIMMLLLLLDDADACYKCVVSPSCVSHFTCDEMRFNESPFQRIESFQRIEPGAQRRG